ncbi:MAG TPA: sigma-70 family RNA polymerase sigma factor [Actinomycetota bacterium]|nr:sigma-70 family RNA polymerase sigma factor [Actinomycetota bacterium]
MSDPQGLERAYREHGQRLWRAVLAYGGDPEIASDAVAEAFAQALRRGSAIREPERWVWTAAFRIAAGELKERRRRNDQPVADPYVLPDEAIELASVLRTLPDKQRAALVLHYYADLPNDRIAEILGITRATVRVHLSQGRRRLKQLLEDDDA